jgi:hypothetical protein
MHCTHPERRAFEQFIAERFSRAYGARLTHFLPHLLGVMDGLARSSRSSRATCTAWATAGWRSPRRARCAPQLRERVFASYYRMPGAAGGLGLAIAREVAEAHGARIAIEGGAGSRGTRVVVRFEAA